MNQWWMEEWIIEDGWPCRDKGACEFQRSGQRSHLELGPGRTILDGPVFQGRSRQTVTQCVGTLQGSCPTIRLSCEGANNPPRRNPFVTKPTRERNRTPQRGDGPQPAPDQRVLINLCDRTRFATWNVQTFLLPGAATLPSPELSCRNITLAGLCGVCWQGTGETTADDHCYI